MSHKLGGRLPLKEQAVIAERLQDGFDEEITCVSVWPLKHQDIDALERFVSALKRGWNQNKQGESFSVIVLEHGEIE